MFELDDKILARYKSTKTDELLEEARKANQFNDVYASFFDEQLLTYQKKLRLVYDSQESKSTRELFSSFNDNAIVLRFSYTPTAE